MALGGALLRFGATGLRLLEFACAAIVLGMYSYFLAVLANHNLGIPAWQKAVEGIAGAAVLYTIFGVIFTLFLGGNKFFGFLGIVLDILFAGAFAAVAYFTRHGANSCSGVVNTPLGTAPTNQTAPGAGHYGYVCSLNTAAFAVSVINILLFLITAVVQVLLVRHHQKEKRFGPSPTNNYTKGTGRLPFWKRTRRNKAAHTTQDAEMATAGTTGTTAAPVRHSHETGMTGSTMNHGGFAPNASEPKYGQQGYGQTHHGLGHNNHNHNNQTAVNY